MRFPTLVASCTLIPALCAAQSQIERYDLACSTVPGGGIQRTFHVEVDNDGNVAITEPASSSPKAYEAKTYVNAYLWEVEGVRYLVDRFTGQLTTKPAGATWQCAKVGGRKF